MGQYHLMKLKYNTNDMKILAEKCGIIFDDQYRGIKKKHKWKCCLGHTWVATPNSIKSGRRCPKCSRSKPRITIEEIHQIAKDQNMILLSQEFTGMKKKHSWKCINGHIWDTTPERIKKGCCCPYCGKSLNEEKVRFIFEQFLREKFPKNRSVLGGLELDGYCQILNLAFEYQGEQHYNEKHYFNSNGYYTKQKENDKKKLQKCHDLGITKIDIPYTESEHLEKYIKQELQNIGMDSNLAKVQWKKFRKFAGKLQDLMDVAKKRNGALLNKEYLGSHFKHTWKCFYCNSTWSATPKDVLQKGSWCPVCANNQKYSLDEICKLCKKFGFIFCSTIYNGMNSKHDIQCIKCGTKWNVRLNRIQQGATCPNCKKGGIKECHLRLNIIC